MTKQQLLRMAEFDEAKIHEMYMNEELTYQLSVGANYTNGAQSEHARLLPLIIALVESREEMKAALRGCSDGNCRFIGTRNGGMHTNGGCHCVDNAKQALTADDARMKGLT